MSGKQRKTLMIAAGGGAIVCLSFALGVFVLKMAGMKPPGPADQPASQTGEPAQDPPAEVTPASGDQITQGARLDWDSLQNGCKVTQAGGVIHIAGISDQDGWDHWNGVRTACDVAGRDFTAAADFKLPAMAGPGNGLVYLRISSENGAAAGILFQGAYRMQLWDPPTVDGSVRTFGDEATRFHRMKLQYDAASQALSGWIDQQPIGSVDLPLSGPVQFWLVANTDNAGKRIDLYFENFTLTTARGSAQLP